MRRMSTNAVARSWRVALADGIAASRKAAASNNSGEVILRKTVPGLGQLHLGASQPLSKQVPGNGGLRLWQYDSPEKASSEAARLGKGVAVKDEKSGQGTSNRPEDFSQRVWGSAPQRTAQCVPRRRSRH